MDHSWGYGSEQRLREENQDSFGVFEFPDYTLAVVCDGMGGHVGGAQASNLAVRTIHDTLLELQGRPVQEAIEEALQRTNLVIYEAARKNHRLMGMGTTAVVAAITSDACYLGHVGDSRAYLLRKGQVQQLTRDHTMVNLFVDAELLSPEDAATHPEAHVLSRSLGVERQVDVELAEPIPMESGDVIFVCSDGVHGVVTDWELANIDWGAPNQGIGGVLDIVANREGDDNATAVAVMMGTSFEDVPATTLPEPRQITDIAAASGITAVPIEEDLAYDTGSAAGRGTPESGGAGYVVYEDHPIVDPNAGPQEIVVAPSEQAPATVPQHDQQQQPAAKQAAANDQDPKKKKKKKKRRSAVLPILVASGALFTALAGAIFLLIPAGAGPEETDGVVAHMEVVDPFGADPDPVPVPAPPTPSTDGAETDGEEVVEDPELAPPGMEGCDEAMFKPELPKPPRRLPHRATQFTQPPPGGPLQFQSVDAARRRDCPTALSAVQLGMKTVSIDHATLYRGAWFCFNEAHQRRLEQADADSWADLTYQLPHFEGTPEKKAAAVLENDELKKLPAWFRPAVGGVEFRLEHFAADPQMDEVLADLFGEPTVTDHLAKDVHMEALAARGLSCIPPEDRTPAIEEAWARRVFVLAWALQSRPGRLFDQHRNELLQDLRRLLDEATTPRVDAEGKEWDVPDLVIEAREVAEGNRPPPTQKVAPKPRNVDPRDLEPSLGEEDDPVIIQRHNGNPR